tara:strand:+ start:297 stop:482 length:186 start_codon:yes stop_codon:yes gene_type:complete
MNNSTTIKKQPKINTSFPQDKQHIYKRLLQESNSSYVPVATLLRNYAEKGMEVVDKELAVA